MKRILSLSAAIFLAGALSACKKGGPIRVDRVVPEQGITAGGDQVVIRGSGFEPGTTQVEVRFGRHKAEQVSISASDKITVVTPPGDKGPVDVMLMFDNGAQFKIPNGFRFVPPSSGDDVRSAFFSGKGEPGKEGESAKGESAK
jgi:hypothetical protein